MEGFDADQTFLSHAVPTAQGVAGFLTPIFVRLRLRNGCRGQMQCRVYS
jgi:hypothetical protein